MGERKHLCSFRIRAVDEDEWGDLVHQRETSELARIELAVRVVANDAVHHHQYANLIGLSGKTTQSISPVPKCSAFL